MGDEPVLLVGGYVDLTVSTSSASKSGEATQSRTISSSDASEVAQNSWYRSTSK